MARPTSARPTCSASLKPACASPPASSPRPPALPAARPCSPASCPPATARRPTTRTRKTTSPHCPSNSEHWATRPPPSARSPTARTSLATASTTSTAAPHPRRVAAFLENRDSKRPLCLFVGTPQPHVPWMENQGYDPDPDQAAPQPRRYPRNPRLASPLLLRRHRRRHLARRPLRPDPPEAGREHRLPLHQRPWRTVALRQVEPVRRRYPLPLLVDLARPHTRRLDDRRHGELDRPPAHPDRPGRRHASRRHRRPFLRPRTRRRDRPPTATSSSPPTAATAA